MDVSRQDHDVEIERLRGLERRELEVQVGKDQDLHGVN